MSDQECEPPAETVAADVAPVPSGLVVGPGTAARGGRGAAAAGQAAAGAVHGAAASGAAAVPDAAGRVVVVHGPFHARLAEPFGR
ncbi:hypothetical protein IQ62_43240 [Streptomyces scabiei]|uniref:hypothetical protein n=1 Tax=Streptomyces scabiei TaxID=1930 RepID=UPI0004E65C02|nr:hypothetical protein [Streptomyces scabiei]KFF95246.1 hypothetical protein IQ62_43240 [Streptomyces scabiei]